MTFSFAIGVLDWLAPIVEDFKDVDKLLKNGREVWLLSREEGPLLEIKRGWRTGAFLSPNLVTLSRNWRGDRGTVSRSQPSRYVSSTETRQEKSRVNFTPALFRETTQREVMSFLPFNRL
jgi:hypothetical protein